MDAEQSNVSTCRGKPARLALDVIGWMKALGRNNLVGRG
jgi:hypothetical protein